MRKFLLRNKSVVDGVSLVAGVVVVNHLKEKYLWALVELTEACRKDTPVPPSSIYWFENHGYFILEKDGRVIESICDVVLSRVKGNDPNLYFIDPIDKEVTV